MLLFISLWMSSWASAGLTSIGGSPKASANVIVSGMALWRLSVVITSHSSGVSEGSTQRVDDLFCENVRRYMSGLPLLNVVDRNRGS
jgi:phosphoglycerate dehydrogenase-like enzyme